MIMKFKIIFIFAILSALMLSGCSFDGESISSSQETTSNLSEEREEYIMITAQDAKKIIDEKTTDYIILDVRTPEEFETGHIENSILIPDYEINKRAENELPDKEQLILVYCRSGNRSKVASAKLAALGYKNVKEFGGINDWPYEIVK